MALQLLILTAGALLTVTTAGAQLQQPSTANLPNPTASGYLDIHKNAGSKIYYQYYEADSKHTGSSTAVPTSMAVILAQVLIAPMFCRSLP
jgi:aspartate/tyrosine/aromatic aminotransferase